MVVIDPKIEYFIIVPGKARSFRSRYAKAYKEKVRKIAREVIIEMFNNDDVDLKIDYFHRGNRNVDMDNITKNVMDALTGIAYLDDKFVKTQNSRAHKIDEIVTLFGEVFDIFKPLVNHKEYLTIRISSKNAYHEQKIKQGV